MRRIVIGLGLALLASPAFAQKSPETYLFTLAPAEVVLIGQALSERPYKDVASLIAKLQQQAQEQINKANQPPTPPEPPKAEEPKP